MAIEFETQSAIKINPQARSIRESLEVLQLNLHSRKTRLFAYSQVGRYIRENDSWPFLSYSLSPEKTGERTLPSVKPPQAVVAWIDSNPRVLKVMKRIFEKNNYEFIGIQEPWQAIPKITGAIPDLIFVDVNMPAIDGYEICTQLRRVPKLKDKPVIMLTPINSDLDRIRAKMAGASGFLDKPIDAVKILDLAKKSLSTVRFR